MSSNLTVAAARQTLWMVADPSNPNSSLFLPLLNQASAAIISDGQWKGTLGEVDFPFSLGYVTLPRRWESIVADRVCCTAAPIYGRYHEFSSVGPSYFNQRGNQNWNMQYLVDHGEFPTEVRQDIALPIRLTIEDPLDAGAIVRLYGVNDLGEIIFDSNGAEGIEYTTVYPFIDIAQPFLLTNVDKPMTSGHISVASVDGIIITPLSRYEPTETNPLYRRYKVRALDQRDDGEPVIRTLCKRRFIPLVNETDIVFPSDQRALKLAMAASKLEMEGAYEIGQSEPYWAKCYQQLNNTLRQYYGAIRHPANFAWAGSGGSIPQTN